MVHQREGVGKISSPHSLKDFGDENPPKMGRCDLNWIIIFSVIHLNAFGVEKVEESSHGTVFTSETQFGEMGSEAFQERFETSNDVFSRKKFGALISHIFMLLYTQISSNDIRSMLIGVCMQTLFYLEVHLHVFTPIDRDDVTPTPIIHRKKGLAM